MRSNSSFDRIKQLNGNKGILIVITIALYLFNGFIAALSSLESHLKSPL